MEKAKKEINFLFNLINSYFHEELINVKQNGIKIKIIGEQSGLPINLKRILKKTINETSKNKKILVNLALNYGSKKELINSFKKVYNRKISEKEINKNLYTCGLPDPDILIRTGGKKRLSNFMLWQLAYAELYFLDKLWPDFQPNDLRKIINNFYKIKRNFGGI